MEMTLQALPGASLDSVLEQAHLPVAQVLRHALRLALALRAAHEKGTVFGVLDPSRIYVAGDLAVIEPPPPGLNAFAAPELFNGATADVRSDIFAFGAIVYRMLTGRHPFTVGFRREVSDGIEEQDPQPLGLVRDGLQQVAAERFPGLERVVLQCLARKPGQRWQTARPICIELKLLVTSVCRQNPAANGRRSVDALVRDHAARLETALAARTAACEQMVRDLEGVICDTRERLLYAINSVEEQVHSQAESIETLRSAAGKTDSVLEPVIASLAACDRAVLEMQHAASATHERVQQDIESMQEKLHSQAASIESLAVGATRTDDLLERVVESIDSLQSFVLERVADV
jgi:hypothetical protein